MPIPKLALCLMAALASADALAFQIGQLVQRSHLGERLDAQVILFGVAPSAAAAMTVEVRPAVGLPAASAARHVVESVTASIALDQAGQPYVALRSSEPVSEAAFDFRLRVAAGPEATIAHFRLNLAPRQISTAATAPARRTAPRPPPTTLAAHAVDGDTDQYGPVRSGQSLWRILSERGFGPTDRDAIIARIVATNPQAFVAGNPDRLRVGAVLSLPAVTSPNTGATGTVYDGKAQVSSTSAVSRTQEVDSTHASIRATDGRRDAALTARLETLSTKFAGIKARYAEQDSRTATAPSSPAPATRPAPTAVAKVEAAASAPALVPAQTSSAIVAPSQARAPEPPRLSGPIVLITGALVSALALGGGLLLFVRGNRRKRTQSHSSTNDQQLLAEITRKTEKRVLLEDTVKRSLGVRRSGISTGTVDVRATELRAVDHRIAHGQYAEAEALLRAMISTSPQDFQAKLRLAEIHYLDENTDAFVALADELYRLHRTEIGDSAWQRIMRMGRMLAPDRPPFSGPVAIPRRA